MTERPATAHSWRLVAARRADAPSTPATALSQRRVLLAVARRGLPNIVEATIVPAVLFLVAIKVASPAVAMALVLAWAYGAILRRLVRRQGIPALLLLATLGVTVRTIVGLVSGSVFAYFLQPIATTVAFAGVFLGSVLIGRPVIARLAHDFCPLAPDVAGRPAIARLFVGLTLLWAGVHLLNAAATLGMLVSMPVPMFVVLKTVGSLAITVGAIVVTVWWALRTARSEELVFADV
jgi:intracellular septation protein A